jgi:hypothetical protein
VIFIKIREAKLTSPFAGRSAGTSFDEVTGHSATVTTAAGTTASGKINRN